MRYLYKNFEISKDLSASPGAHGDLATKRESPV